VPEILETAVATALQKDPGKRFQSGLELAASLTRVNQHLTEREGELKITMQQRFDLLRRLRFFHDFSHGEIWEVLRASDWRDYSPSEEIVREGEMDDRFYIIVSGEVEVRRGERVVGRLAKGDCFGETSYVKDARRTATISAAEAVTLMRVSSTLLEQVSAACQLRFMRMFLHTLIERLQSNDRAPAAS
jgi:CRP-like cAMP-binding protein